MRDAELRDRLAELGERGFNYDADGEGVPDDPRWHRDAYAADLGREAPGPPEDGGVFARGREVLVHYRFPDPKRLSGFFDEETPLLGRTMLLRAKFLWFRFDFGVRVTRVVDATRVKGDTTLHEFGYAYRTLKEHWEIGEIFFCLRKDADSGAVRFLIESYSRPDRIPNPFYRLGFRIFGRKLQREFAENGLRRMKRLVAEAE